ncbi:uncharacterized protein [Canis lupus baileyi]|uniref:uncharacterized protein isoform X3 n=1 Tax=Canis lupus baileyi TaxID=143281 RepID=UPI003B96ABC0
MLLPAGKQNSYLPVTRASQGPKTPGRNKYFRSQNPKARCNLTAQKMNKCFPNFVLLFTEQKYPLGPFMLSHMACGDAMKRRDTCTPMSIAAMSTIAKLWKEPRCPSKDEWIKKMWFMYTMEYYSAIRNDKYPPFASTWMELEGIMLSESLYPPQNFFFLVFRVLKRFWHNPSLSASLIPPVYGYSLMNPLLSGISWSSF